MNTRIIPALALIVAIAIFFIYINPTWNGSISKTNEAISADNEALKAADTYAEQQVELTRQQNDIDPTNLARLETFLPDSVDNVGLILDLNTLAARSGISLSNIDVIAKSKNSSGPDAIGAIPVLEAGPIDFIDLSLSAVGTYTAFQAFLIGVEKSARLLDVRELIIKGSDNGVYSYKMTIRFYWLRS